jgi:alcohol dehydrogenase class IV
MSYQITGSIRTIIGENALETAGDSIKKLGKKAFVVTGKVITRTGLAGQLAAGLGVLGITTELFNDIEGEPTDRMVAAGIQAYKSARCDFIIGFGGGSPLDTAKAIAVFSSLDGKIADYAGKEIEGVFPPLVLIPTTAGTGSETTKFAVITDTSRNVKLLLKGDGLLPCLAVIDYTYALSSPRGITAATGMDALTHAVEAYTSRKACPLTDLYALSAIKRIFTSLPAAYRNGADRKAREEMALAAYEAGFCINNSSVTLVHGMSRPIGALFHVPHGVSNAMLISECLRFALDGCYDRFADIARVIGAASESSGDRVAAESFITALDGMCRTLDIPSLAAYGIDRDAFARAGEKMAADALASGSPANTVKPVTKEDILAVYRRLWK